MNPGNGVMNGDVGCVQTRIVNSFGHDVKPGTWCFKLEANPEGNRDIKIVTGELVEELPPVFNLIAYQ
jgi:hypothetical protein